MIAQFAFTRLGYNGFNTFRPGGDLMTALPQAGEILYD